MKKIYIIITIVCAFVLNTKSQVNLQDSLALVDIYNNTDGSNWNYANNWLVTEVRLWEGVTVINNRVTNLKLNYKNLNGNLPSTIGQLIELEELAINGNNLDSIPIEITTLCKLKFLSLSYNNFEGKIPINIGNLSNLESITIIGNKMVCPIPESIGMLDSLKRIDIRGYITDIPESIGNLSNLESIFIEGYRYDTAPFDSTLTSIPESIGNLQKLKGITINGCASCTIPESIGNISNLGGLGLERNNLTGSVPETFSNLTNLSIISLSENKLDSLPQDSIWAGMSKMQFFHIDMNEFHGLAPHSPIFLPLISMYNIGYNNFTDLPDFSSWISTYSVGRTLVIWNNNFTFDDIEPLIYPFPVAMQFHYAPQDSINRSIDTVAALNSMFALSCITGGSANHYQWFKNDTLIPGATNNTLFFPSVNWTDAGKYVCRVTNDICTELTLWQRNITMRVSDTITSYSNIQSINENVIIYPNPASSRITIASKQLSVSTNRFVLYDLFGKEVLATEIKEQTIDISQITQGVYVYRIIDNKGIMKSGKLVVIK